MTIKKIIDRAIRMNRVKDGFVLCDNCDTPASKSLSTKLSWTGCAPCVWGEAASYDTDDLISVESAKPYKTYEQETAEDISRLKKIGGCLVLAFVMSQYFLAMNYTHQWAPWLYRNQVVCDWTGHFCHGKEFTNQDAPLQVQRSAPEHE